MNYSAYLLTFNKQSLMLYNVYNNGGDSRERYPRTKGEVVMGVELTGFDKRVCEIVREFQMNNLECEDYEVIQLLDIPPTDRNFKKVQRAFIKIKLLVKEMKKDLCYEVSRN